MRTIAKHHFNKDMDEYIKARKGSRPKWQIKFKVGKRKKPAGEVPMEIPEHEVKNVLDKKPVQDKALLEAQEPEDNRPGFFEGLFGSIFGKKVDYEDAGDPVQDEPEKPQGELDPEVIEVLKIAGKWLGKMPKELKLEFKESQDYAKYKFYLDKWGLTKKKE